MIGSITTFIAASAAMASAASIPAKRSSTASITPHDQYSSSVGVLGCKINTNRVAYWPGSVSCDDICVKVSHNDRSVWLLKVDSSEGAHDISYDAWNFLAYGESATSDPHEGGGIEMEYEFVNPAQCQHHLNDGKVPLSASNSMNYLASCLEKPDSFVAKNHQLFNILDPVCTQGRDETCSLDLDVSNQPKCPHTLGGVGNLEGLSVYNIQYGTGNKKVAQ